jgi:PAS domain S-box-containing protein
MEKTSDTTNPETSEKHAPSSTSSPVSAARDPFEGENAGKLAILILVVGITVELAVEILDDRSLLRGFVVEISSLIAFLLIMGSALMMVFRVCQVRGIVNTVGIGVLLIFLHQGFNVTSEIPYLAGMPVLSRSGPAFRIAQQVTLVGGLGFLLAGFYFSLIEVRRSQERTSQGMALLEREVIERKHAQEALRRSEELHRGAIEVAGAVPYIQTYEPEAYPFIGEGIRELVGLAPEEFSKKWDSILQEVVLFGSLVGLDPSDALGRCRTEGLTWRADFRVLTPGGEEKWIANAAVQVRDETGRITGSLGTLQDVTERKRAEEALERAAYDLNSIIESTADGILVVDSQGRTVYANSRFRDMWRIPDHLMTLKDDHTLLDYVLDQIHDPEAFLKKVEDLYQLDEEAWDTIRFKDGRIFERFSRPLVREGRIQGRLWSFRDVTERKQAEERLQLQSAALESASNGIVITDADGTIQWVNEAFVELTGYTREAAIGKNPRDLVKSGEQDEAFYQELWGTITEGRVWRGEIVNRRKDGSLFPEELTITPVRGGQGGISHFVSTMQDISGRKRAEEDRLSFERRLLHSQKLESLGVLAGGIAHDFNNLLVAILGNLEMAMMDLSPVSSARSSVAAAVHAAMRAADLTHQMLAYSGRGRFVIEDLDLSELVAENAHMFRAAIAKTVTLNLEPGLSLPPVLADGGQIQQIVMNLITNASEAIGDGPGTVTLSTGVMECGEDYLSHSRLEKKPAPGWFAYLEVTDTGCGMDKETQERLFDPFFTTKFTGRGLGMSAVLGIVRGHKGALLVDSQPAKGATIRVLLPVSNNAQGGSADDPERAQKRESDKVSLSGLVLVVDDEELVRDLTVKMLERTGLRALTAADGEEAEHIFRESAGDIDCVILDLTMPRCDGVATFQALRKIKSEVKVILCSGYDKEDATQRFTDQGLAGFLKKPFQFEGLTQVLHQVLEPPRSQEG